MTIQQAKMQFANDLTKLINDSKLPPTMIRNVLFDMDRAVAQLEEQQYQQALSAEAEKEGEDA